MVNQTTASLLDAYLDSDEFALESDSARNFSPKREQPSRSRYATQARYSRRRSNSNAPRGPRRRLNKPNGL